MLSVGFQMHLASHFIPCNCKVNISFERAAWEETSLTQLFAPGLDIGNSGEKRDFERE
jgi:hypothetical protein